eukprot:362982-Chlamydomonas_euryale.AAC.1
MPANVPSANPALVPARPVTRAPRPMLSSPMLSSPPPHTHALSDVLGEVVERREASLQDCMQLAAHQGPVLLCNAACRGREVARVTVLEKGNISAAGASRGHSAPLPAARCTCNA